MKTFTLVRELLEVFRQLTEYQLRLRRLPRKPLVRLRQPALSQRLFLLVLHLNLAQGRCSHDLAPTTFRASIFNMGRGG